MIILRSNKHVGCMNDQEEDVQNYEIESILLDLLKYGISLKYLNIKSILHY